MSSDLKDLEFSLNKMKERKETASTRREKEPDIHVQAKLRVMTTLITCAHLLFLIPQWGRGS